MTLAKIRDEHEISCRLRHLASVDVHHRLMHPVAGKGLPRHRLGLGAAALVMGIEQIDTSAMQIDRGTKFTKRERAAFDVPTGAAAPPSSFPGGFARLTRTPQHEVERMPLAAIAGVLTPLVGERRHPVLTEPRQRAEVGDRSGVEIDDLVADVGDTLGKQGVDDAANVRNHAGGAVRTMGEGH